MNIQISEKLLPQAGAIPFRKRKSGLEVLLITSRGTGRWLFPKGNIEPDMTACELAAMEAFEEAGVVGRIGARPLGTYTALKRVSPSMAHPAVVEMFPLDVAECHDDWPEQHQRRRRWVSAGKSVDMVCEPGLKVLIIQLRDRLRREAA